MTLNQSLEPFVQLIYPLGGWIFYCVRLAMEFAIVLAIQSVDPIQSCDLQPLGSLCSNQPKIR